MAMKIRTYGTLRLTDNGNRWEMANIEPHVAIRLKQLFPRISKTSTGPFYFPNDATTAADLDWFTSRYPLEIVTVDRQALTQGRGLFENTQAELERILLPDWKQPTVVGLRAGQELRHYQAQVCPIVQATKGLLLGDEGGLGKTYAAAGCMIAITDALPAVVVCEPHIQTQWREKIEAFTTLRVHCIKGTRPYDLPIADVYVFRYTQIAGWVDIITKGLFKFAVYDEPQALRTGEKTQKGMAARVLSDSVTYCCGLTATPIYNWGAEIWNVLRFIRPEVLGSRHEFEREWCTEDSTRVRIKDPKALGTYLREQHAFLRRTKKDVGKEMPPVNRIVEHINYDAEAVKSVEDLAHQLAIKATTGTFIERGQAVRELDMLARQATGIGKAPFVADFVRLLVEAGEPVVLWGWHRSFYDICIERLSDLNPAMYTGSETASKKTKSKEAFLRGDTDLLIMSLRSGAGVDDFQHRCSTGVFGELDWSPGILQQCVWRLDREGQKDPVTAFFLVTDDGSDPPMMEMLGLKSSEATNIVDPYLGVQSVHTDTNHLRKLVDRYLHKKRAGNTQTSEIIQVPPARAISPR